MRPLTLTLLLLLTLGAMVEAQLSLADLGEPEPAGPAADGGCTPPPPLTGRPSC